MPHVDSFLLVVPEGFVEVPGATAIIVNNGGVEALQPLIEPGGTISDLDEWAGMRESGSLPEGYTVTAARFFNTAEPVEPFRLWIAVAPIVE